MKAVLGAGAEGLNFSGAGTSELMNQSLLVVSLLIG